MTVASITDLGEKIAEVLVNAICEHPSLIGWFVGVFLIATLTNTGIKFTWTYSETPRWARFILGVTMPLALNFYHFGEKIGITQPSTPTGTISPAAVLDAIKRDGDAKP